MGVPALAIRSPMPTKKSRNSYEQYLVYLARQHYIFILASPYFLFIQLNL
jgi:hypothetical protein